MSPRAVRTTPTGETAADDGAEVIDDGESAEHERLLGDFAILDGNQVQDVSWVIYRLRTRAEMQAEGGATSIREFVDKKTGPLDLLDVARELGGGTFDFYPVFDNGDGRGRALQRRQRHTLAGPRRNYAESPVNPPTVHVTATPVTPLAAGPAPAGQLDVLAQVLAKMDDRASRQHEQLLTVLAQRGGDSGGLKELIGGLVALDQLRGTNKPKSPLDDFGAVMTVFQKGLDLGQEREPIPTEIHTNEANAWMPIIERALDTVGRIVAARRPAGPPTGSHAVPVDMPPTPPSSPSPQPEVVTATPAPEAEPAWIVAIEALADAVANADDPADFADFLQRILGRTRDWALMRFATADDIFARIPPAALEALPVLKRPEARSFVEAVLVEIQRTDQVGPDDSR